MSGEEERDVSSHRVTQRRCETHTLLFLAQVWRESALRMIFNREEEVKNNSKLCKFVPFVDAIASMSTFFSNVLNLTNILNVPDVPNLLRI